MVKETGSFVNSRGQKLHTASWMPDEGTAVQAVLWWHHGLGDYVERSGASFEAWNAAGIAVVGFDAHGMGKSEPLDEPGRGYIRKFQYLVDDAIAYYTDFLKPALEAKGLATVPLFMGGTSMGGLMASYIVFNKPEIFSGLIMQSPAIDVEWTPLLRFQASIGNVLAALMPRAKLVPAVRAEDMSQDPEVRKAYLEDPIVYHGNVRAVSANELLKGFRGLVAHRGAFKLPILGVHGTSDRCTSLPALREHLKHVPSPDVTLHEVEGGYHELLQGPEKEQVRAQIRDWVLDRAKNGPRKPAPKEEPKPAEAAAPAEPKAEAATPAEPKADGEAVTKEEAKEAAKDEATAAQA
ncbi:hypothetical protein HYH03_005693 [Edaphochlamys debaryana]|uniref:Serine aminopeptidase S33 domain-containing protein n=1 Tax=Edaphochlamys debaryana TaxID=47281 RepID=A0A836C0U8_9CHLO|nr:hypothetical protein HYH03_005693 [Edaphochlamys debaryana]|eukprot:KAG2496090.1 hypothetical protein HYH03_005693 [Edaphochlamys debaryana]